MRHQQNYIIFWLPAFTVCLIVSGCFFVMWGNAPEIPSQGMEALIGLPYAMVSLAMLPFLVGTVVLLWKYPHHSSLKPSYVIPTFLLSALAVALYFTIPRASDSIYDISLAFVDEKGMPVSDVVLKISHSSPGFDIMKGGREHREEDRFVSSDKFTLQKKKGEETEVRIEKVGYYFATVLIPHVWPANRDFGLQKISFQWQKDRGGGRWGRDMCQSTQNWPPLTDDYLKVVMLRLDAAAISPLPEYTEEDFRTFERANKR